MSSQLKVEIARKQMQRKIKELHTHSYLTLLSIGQAVSFHILSEEIAYNETKMFVPLSLNFPFCPWLLSLETFIILILVWNDFFMVISVYTWIPSLLDATILFSLFATEVFMAKTIMYPQNWLIAVTVFLFFCLMAFANTLNQSKKVPENEVQVKMTIKRIRLSMLMIFILMCCLIFIILLGKIAPHLYWLGIILATVVIVSFTLNTIGTWRHTKAFIEGKKEMGV